jgi:hypothetical protein
MHPSAISIQIGNTDVNAAGQMLPAGISLHVRIAAIIPFIPRIPSGISHQVGIPAQKNSQPLSGSHKLHKFVVCSFQLTLSYYGRCFTIRVDLKAIGSSTQSIESRSRGIDLKFEAARYRQSRQSNHNA